MDSVNNLNEHPLRPYYVQPAIESNWSTPSPSITRASTSSNTTTASYSIPPSGYLNRYEDSSAIPYYTSNEGVINGGRYLKSFMIGSFLTFTSTALVMPFEVGKTLAQVQYVPRILVDDDHMPSTMEEEEEVSPAWCRMEMGLLNALSFIQLEDEDQVEAYFSDLQSQSRTGGVTPTLLLPPRSTSPSGYLRRSRANDATFGTKPEWIMPVVVQGGVWDMMRTLSKWKGEGWSSLWKGQLTTCCWDACSASIQPLLLAPLTLIFLPASSSALAALPLMHSASPGPLLFLSTFSHVVTTVFLSPVDLIRTRLIVQSAQPQHRKYSGPLDAFNTIIKEEGGLYTTYFHPHLLFPALLEGILRPLIFLATPLIISRSFHIEPSSSPILFACAEFVLGSLGLLITIPIETVRKRLQIQTRAKVTRGGKGRGGRAWRTCVETREAPYAGMVDAVYRILTEETGRIPRRNRRRSSFNSANRPDAPTEGTTPEKEDLGELGAGRGVRQLYRGLGMGIGANVVVLLLGVLAGGADDRLRWTEM